MTVTQWGCPSGQVESAREHLAREVEALLARTRQLRDPSLARPEQLLDEAFTVFRAPTTETRSCAATAVAS